MARVRIIIEYDPDWTNNLSILDLDKLKEKERCAWIDGDVTVQDVIVADNTSTVNIEVTL